MDYKSRIHRLRQHMDDHNIKVSIISKPMNQYYLTGFITITYARPIITVVEMDRCTMVLPSIEENLARETSVADHFMAYHEHPEGQDRGLSHMAHLETILRRYPAGTQVGTELGFISAIMTDSLRAKGYGLADVNGFVMGMRQIKGQAELDIIRTAGRIVGLGVAKTIETSMPGNTETDIDQAGTVTVTLEVLKALPDAIVDKFTMSPSGVERTFLPHAPSGMRRLEAVDMVLHNRQLIINGYHAECQRTYFIGKPTDKQRELFGIMVEAQQAAIDAVRPGIRACDIDNAARAVIQKAGYGEMFNHRTGKGVGLEMLEEPFLRFDNTQIIEENMVISLHPGLYCQSAGGFRHSDTVIVTKTGGEVVTRYPKSLECLILQWP